MSVTLFSQDYIEELNVGMTYADKAKVLKWVSQQVKESKTPYCYRQSYGRGVGEALTSCPPGTEKNGALCYPVCGSGYSGAGPVCWQNCPSGFRNDGAYCAKPGSYGRGAGYPWKFGDALGSLDGARERCKKANKQGCEKYGEIIYPKCKPGFKPAGCCVCSPICPGGMTDIGVSCQKRSYGRGAGTAMDCRSGLEKDGALCYPKCKPGYHGVGPVCWQDCPSTQPVNCGAGCATTSANCAEKTANMVISPIMLAINIFTLGASSELTAAKSSFTAALKARNIAAARTAMARTVNAYARAFEQLTTRQVANTLRARLTTNAYKFVVTEYAKIQVKLAMQESFSEEDLRSLAALDPTGVASVVEAFTQKICEGNVPFPALSRQY